MHEKISKKHHIMDNFHKIRYSSLLVEGRYILRVRSIHILQNSGFTLSLVRSLPSAKKREKKTKKNGMLCHQRTHTRQKRKQQQRQRQRCGEDFYLAEHAPVGERTRGSNLAHGAAAGGNVAPFAGFLGSGRGCFISGGT